MPNRFDLRVPIRSGDFPLTLKTGEILFILGANGSGKSGLISQLFHTHYQTAKRISAHRQTWFTSNTLDLTPHTREDLEQSIKSQDRQEHSRWRQDYAAKRATAAIYDLIDSDTMLARSIANLVRMGDIPAAQEKAKSPSPIETVNQLLLLSNLPIEISVEERQKVVASRNQGPPYSVAELSDGERNAFLIASDVLTAKKDTLLLIDEPERHLHRSIISPLLSLLFKKRQDCAFVVSTHELLLPIDNPSAQTLLLRSCNYQGSTRKYWTVDLLRSDASIDDEMKRDILGSRNKIIFVEGTRKSLDYLLYSLLFPQVSIVPKSNCRNVENAVRGLRESAEMHWVLAWGIVDNDRRSSEEVDHLKESGVYALSHFSIESIYYHPEMIRRVASRQAEVTGDDPSKLANQAIDSGIDTIQSQGQHMISKVVEKLVRRKIFAQLPRRKELQNISHVALQVDVDQLRNCEEIDFDHLIEQRDFEVLVQRYPFRESGALERIARGVGLSRHKYEDAVRKLLQDDDDALSFCRGLFGDLPSEIDSV